MRPARAATSTPPSAAMALASLLALALWSAACSTDDPGVTPSGGSDAGSTASNDSGSPSGGDAAQPDAGAADASDAAAPFVPAFFDVNHILSTGQSLSVGSQGIPALSKAQPFDNEMFVTGVLAGGTGLTSVVPLIEGNVETMSAGMSTLVTDLAKKQGLEHRVMVSCHGVGGTAYAGLKKGTASFTNGMAQVTAASSLATKAGRSYVVRAVTNVHGESDHVAQNALYEQNMVEWQKDYETDVTAITGQKAPIPMLHTQMSSWTKYGQATSAIPGAQLDASVKSGGKIVMVGPKYFLTYAPDGVHLANEGYRHMGEYYAKVYRRVILEGKAWEPLRPKSATVTGDEIRVVFHVPAPPLVLDSTLVTQAAASGFEYTDESGAPPTITLVTLDGPDAVKIKLSAAPTGGRKRVRYAYTGVVGALGGPTAGPRGNLRDSDATPSRNAYPLYNWAVHFDLAVP